MRDLRNSPAKVSLQKEGLLPQEEKLEKGRKKKNLVIGLPAESDSEENRIAITPEGVEILVANGHKIIIESLAGKGANYSDKEYSEAGGIIVDEKTEVFKCDLILKTGMFSLEEIELLSPNQTIISPIRAATVSEEYFRSLMRKKVTALAYEFIKDDSDTYPVVNAMSEISGSASILIAAEYLSNVNKGKGVMLGGITGISPTEVMILGAGTAGESAARTALGLGATLKVFDSCTIRLKRLEDNLGQRIFTSVLHSPVLEKALKSADVAIGALTRIINQPEFVVSEEMVKKMKKGAVIVDISVDQEACFETSRITSHSDPVFRKFGVIHYCVPNLPSRVSRTATIALSNVFLPLLLKKGLSGGMQRLIREDAGIRNGTYIYNGILTNESFGSYFGIQSKDIELLLAAF
ncbi:alanine dehydrogenase [Bacteroidota bacterium]